MIRNILSVLIGIVAAVLIFMIVESLNASIHPLPSDFTSFTPEMLKEYYNNQAFLFWLLILVGWGIGSILCGLIIKLISKSSNKKLPLIAGSLLTLSAIANFFLIPHPIWFIIVGLLVFIPATLLGFSVYPFNEDKA